MRCIKCGKNKSDGAFNHYHNPFGKGPKSLICDSCFYKYGVHARQVKEKPAVDDVIEHFETRSECYIRKAKKLLAGETVDPHCGGEE